MPAVRRRQQHEPAQLLELLGVAMNACRVWFWAALLAGVAFWATVLIFAFHFAMKWW